MQNAAGGTNQATVEEFRVHMSTTSILLSIIVGVLALGVLYMALKVYKRCHMRWMTQEIDRNTVRRSWLRRPQPATSSMQRPEVV